MRIRTRCRRVKHAILRRYDRLRNCPTCSAQVTYHGAVLQSLNHIHSLGLDSHQACMEALVHLVEHADRHADLHERRHTQLLNQLHALQRSLEALQNSMESVRV